MANVVETDQLSHTQDWVLVIVASVVTLALIAYVINFRGIAYKINLRGGAGPEHPLYRAGVMINRIGLCIFVVVGIALIVAGIRALAR
ncbi:hypothetical protein [Streptacidiphilus sp. MAP5-3]|uniref:hypothetical protein n=1 Tax=unclassified Streptacidiphilus TaxID=2643834 RepID=UPI0035151D12